MAKGLICGFLGILTATIGIDSVTSYIRFSDNVNLLSGVQYIPVMIGLFALSQAFETIEDIYSKDEVNTKLTLGVPGDAVAAIMIGALTIQGLTPIIFLLCVIGSFAMRNNLFDVGVMLVAGIIGYFMGKVKIPTSPAILGLILGPICWFFLALIAFTLFGTIRGQIKKAKAAK